MIFNINSTRGHTGSLLVLPIGTSTNDVSDKEVDESIECVLILIASYLTNPI